MGLRLVEAHDVVADGTDVSWQARLRADMLRQFTLFVRTMDNAGQFLTEEEAATAQNAGRAHLVMYQALAEDAWENDVYLWKLRPKMHYVAHVIEELTETYENPACTDLFSWEDFVGKVKRVAAKTHRKTTSLRVVQRWMLVLMSRWTSRTSVW